MTALAEAIRKAEEALAKYTSYCARRIDDENPGAPTLRETVLAMADALRSLLDAIASPANGAGEEGKKP